MKRILFFIVVVFCLYSFITPKDDSWRDKVISNFMIKMKMAPQEKLYLHTDREHYEAGDKIWFRAYLTDATTHMPSDFSRFIYVELTDRQDSVYQRIKIACIDSVFSGYMDVAKKLPQGEYFLRAYSYWMLNQGEDFLFKKKIRVVNSQDSKVRTEVKYSEKEGKQVVKIRFANFQGQAYNKVFVNYQINQKDTKGKTRIQRTDENGEMEIKLDQTSNLKNIFVKFGEEGPFEFERYLYIPDFLKDFDVSFFPEGGDLLAGGTQNIAFKAIGNDGFAMDVEGSVYDDTGEMVAMFKSAHRGMGGFLMAARPGRKYHAVVKTVDSLEKKFDLPQVKRSGIALKTLVRDSVLLYSVMQGDSTVIPKDLHLVINLRGLPVVIAPLRGRLSGKIGLNVMPEGIMHLLLMDTSNHIYSQRLCFNRKKNRPELTITSDKKSYTSRDRVTLDFKLSDYQLDDCRGSFSIAVVDDGKVERDSLGGNILSQLLLTSDLKGYIEDPGYYFRDVTAMTDRHLDLLMMTQGWTRFDVAKIADRQFEKMPFYMERGQTISGKVKNFWGKDAQQAKLIVLGTNGVIRMADADSAGLFMVDGIAFPDGIKFVVQGQNRKGRRSVEVVMDRDTFTHPVNMFPYNRQIQEEEDQFYKKFMKDYYYDNGIKVYVLDEAVVRRKQAKKTYSFYDNVASYTIDSAKIASMKDLGLRWILQELPGVNMLNDKVTRYGDSALLIVVNDFEEQFDYLDRMLPEDILSISLLDKMQGQMFFGESGANGVLVITTNPTFVPRDRPKLNMAIFSPMGYQKPAAFYVPRYDIDSVRVALKDTSDMRSTIYWNPKVCTDVHGNAKVSFFTADIYGTYSVIVEGLLRNGMPCRKEEKITLKLP